MIWQHRMLGKYYHFCLTTFLIFAKYINSLSCKFENTSNISIYSFLEQILVIFLNPICCFNWHICNRASYQELHFYMNVFTVRQLNHKFTRRNYQVALRKCNLQGWERQIPFTELLLNDIFEQLFCTY